MPLERLSFVKKLALFGIIYATDPLLQNMTKIVCLRTLTHLRYITPVDHAGLSALFFKIIVVFHTLYL